MTDLLGDGGVMKLVRTPGAGPQVPPGSRVTVHYVGQFEACDEPFDSTYVRNKGRPENHLVGENSQVGRCDGCWVRTAGGRWLEAGLV